MTNVKGPDPRPNIPAIVTGLIDDMNINRQGNDYIAHLRSRNPTMPGIMVAHQYRFDVREAKKLVAAIAKLPKSHQSGVLKELLKRATLDRVKMPSMGGVALSENAAKELNKFGKKIGVDVDFQSGQPRPVHPVG